MKRQRMMIRVVLAVSLIMTLAAAAPVAGAETGAVSIARLEICADVQDREPVWVASAFTADTAMVYCFLEARDIAEDTTVSFVWFHGDDEVARVPVRLGQSSRWRTYSSKKLGGRIGDWRVEVQDAQNTVLGAVDFSVE